MAGLLSFLGSLPGRAVNTVNNDVVKPINRDVVQPVNNAVVKPIGQTIALAPKIGALAGNEIVYGANSDQTGQAAASLQDSYNKSLLGMLAHPFLRTAYGLSQVPDAVRGEFDAMSSNPAIRASGIARTNAAQQRVYGTNDSGTLAKKILGDTAQEMLTVGAPAAGKAVTGAVGAALPEAMAGTVDATTGKLAPSLLTKLISNTATGAGVGGSFNVASNASAGGKMGAKDIAAQFAKGAALGGGIGGGLTLAGPAAGAATDAVKSGASKAAETVKEMTPTAQAANHPAVQALNDHLQLLNKVNDNLTAQGLSEKSAARINNAKAYAATLEERNATMKSIAEGGYVGKGPEVPNPENLPGADQVKNLSEADKIAALKKQNAQGGTQGNESMQHNEAMNTYMFQKSGLGTPEEMAKANADMANLEGKSLAKGKGGILTPLDENGSIPNKGKTPPPNQPPAEVPPNNETGPNTNTKTRGLSAGVQESPEFSDKLKAATKDQPSTQYSPFTNKAATTATDEFMKQPLADAQKQVIDSLTFNDRGGKAMQAFTGEFGKQEVANAGAVMKTLDASGDTAGAQQIHDLLSQKLTNAGQTSQAAQLIYNRTPEGLKYMALRDISKALGPDYLDNHPQLVDTLNKQIEDIKNAEPGSKAEAFARGKFAQTVGRSIPSSFTDKAVGLWKAGILSAPITATKVAMVNPITATLETAKDIPGAAFDKAISLFTGKRTLVAPNPTNIGAGLEEAATSGLKDAATKFRTNVTMPGSSSIGVGELSSGTASHPLETSFGLNKEGERSLLDKLTGGASTKVLRGYTQFASRTHGALSTPVYEGRAATSLMNSAQAEAINRGLSGDAKTAFIADFTANPESYGRVGKEALANAEKDAQYATSQQKTMLGQAGSGVQHNLGPVGQFIAPITRIPGAVATQVINYSPVGFAKAGIEAIAEQVRTGNFDQRALSSNLGRAATGTGLMWLGSQLMANGRMSGTYPKDKDTQALWQQENIPANSIYVGGTVTKNSDGTFTRKGGTWQQIASAGGPGAQALLTGGQIHEGIKQGGIAQGAIQGASGGGQIILDQPYLSGISGLSNAVNDPASSKSFIDQEAASIVPNFIRTGAVASDPTQRQTSVQSPVTSAKNAVTNAIPGLRENNLPQVDVFGNEQKRNNGPISTYLNPLRPQKENDTPLQTELNSVHNATDPTTGKPLSTPSQIDKKYNITMQDGTKRTLTDAERTAFIQASGQPAQQALTQLIQSPQYQGADMPTRSKLISDTMSAYRTETKANIPDAKVKVSNRDASIASGNLPSVNVKGTDINPGLDQNTQRYLIKMNGLSSTDREKAFNSSTNEEYNYNLAKYQNDKANGTLTAAQDIKARAALAKDKVGSSYDKNIRDLYGLSKSQIADYVTGDPNGQAIANQLDSYDQALYNAGIISKPKFGNSGSASYTTRNAAASKAEAARNKEFTASGITGSNPFGVNTNLSSLKGLLQNTFHAPKVASTGGSRFRGGGRKPVLINAGITKTRKGARLA